MITISDFLMIHLTKLTVIWDLNNLGQFDHKNWMITLSVITLSGFYCNFKKHRNGNMVILEAPQLIFWLNNFVFINLPSLSMFIESKKSITNYHYIP
jgi:hypothetical protein